MQWFEHLHAAGVTMSRLEVDPVGSRGFGLCQSMAAEEVCAWPDAAEVWMRDIGALPGGLPARR